MSTRFRSSAWVLVPLFAVGCTKAVRLNPELEAEFERATNLVRTDDKTKFAEAERLFQKVIAGAPGYDQAVYWKAQLLIAWSDTLLEEAVYLAEAQTELAGILERARAKEAVAKTPEAKAFAQMLVTSIRERHTKVGATLVEWTKEAEELQKRGLELVKSNIAGKADVPYQAHRILADYYRITGDNDRARQALETVRGLEPDSSGLHFVSGVMMMRGEKKDLEGAITSMDKALAGDPEFVKALYFKGLALAEKHDHDGAEETMRAVLKKSPGHLGAKTYLQITNFVHQATLDLEKSEAPVE